ncbi:tRNA (uracil-5-)-methyltransferase [Luminiphilus syltensis NOR5-1B]|uniref:tRNA/tmRNA (uracil-C(5))-methyltransferase n=1 Tax=Luminiphilus syltensis NOR5-1B TaxID=565045 RepID=B8KQS7_9GAMM|nr:tRNA (uridine(54)-C5)-methyltransferase TrmA [Luminiphilus syltensis]EED35568.1 tRNA (uracil-5-)-methyltransferase [Luminiphilus syltensis NOR5-1B]
MPLSNVQPDRYQTLLDAKVKSLVPRFLALGASEPDVFTSPTTGFRMRAEFRVWHDDDDLYYVMFKPGDGKAPVRIDHFPIACDTIQQIMPRLLTAVRNKPLLRRKLFQVEFLATTTGELLVTLVYHRPLDGQWQEAAEHLRNELNVSLIGRSRKQKIILGRDWVEERLTVDDRVYRFRQPEQAFTQPNARVNTAMITWAKTQCHDIDGDLLELYCGIGNFTLPLASEFDRVIATEMSKPATAAANYNREVNGIDNVEFARLSAEDMTAALRGERLFRRLAHLHKPLSDYRLSTLLVDPPRAGLDPATEALATGFDTVLYVSCNPETLLKNLDVLTATHAIKQFAVFDQFPYTHHLECAVLLKRATA